MNDERQISRRRVLETLGAVAVLSCTGCFVGGGSAAKLTGPIAGGTLTDYPVGSLKAVPGGEALAVGRDADGLYALSTICTHSECDMTTDGTIDASGLLCTCHGSVFDANGAVTKGPAKTALQHYAVELGADGALTVQASQTATATARTAVPAT